MTLRLLHDIPDQIPPGVGEAVVWTVLTYPACHPKTVGLQVIYRRVNDWRLEIVSEVKP